MRMILVHCAASGKNLVSMLLAGEIVGAVGGIDPETGHYYDDTRRYIDAVDWLDPADREKIYAGNVRRVYPRLRRPAP